jgi:L-asparaginase
MNKQQKILIIYSGGTIGMTESSPGGPLVPFDFFNIIDHLPELKRFDLKIDIAPFQNPIDSSDVDPLVWKKIAELIIVQLTLEINAGQAKPENESASAYIGFTFASTY